METINFGRVKELRDALIGLPDERIIACQLIGAEKGVWIMWGSFTPLVPNGDIAVMQFKHSDLKTLPMSDEAECDHKYVFKSNDSFWRENGRYSNTYTSIDYYYCEKCLDEKIKKKEFMSGGLSHNDMPDWARIITKKVL